METIAIQQTPTDNPNLLIAPGLPAPIVPRQRTIMSAHFMPCRERFMHSRRQEFFLPAAKKPGDYTYCTVFDSQQEMLNTSDPFLPPNQAGIVRQFVSVESVVENCINNWGFLPISMMGLVRLGIFPIVGGKGEGTVEEKAKCDKFEEIACRSIVEQADRFDRGVEKGVITDFHRAALLWLGSEQRSWYRPIEKGKQKVSVATGNRIAMTALVDGGVNLVDLYVLHELDPADYEDEYVFNRPELLERARKRLGIGAKPKA